MANFFKDNDDLQYYFDKGLDWDALVSATEQVDKEFESTEEALELYREMMSMIGEFVASDIAPYAAEIDHQGVEFEDGEVRFPPRLTKIFDTLKNLDVHGLMLPRELGGMNLPILAYFAQIELMSRAEVSVMSHHGFHAGIALAALVLSIEEGTTTFDEDGRIKETRFETAIREIIAGEAWGCMDITEPDAGSDMASLRTKATLGEDDVWRLTGEKIFITSGHGKYHFVIARTEDAKDPNDPMSGLAGLSMFLVPTYEMKKGKKVNLAKVTRVEEKLGHHGSATCSIAFEESPAHLVGKRGEGFRYMLYLMNTARVGVGFECIGQCEAAYRLARDYAAERKSMGVTLDQHELIADYLDEMRVDILGMRALAMAAGYHEEMSHKLGIRARFMKVSETEKRELERQVKKHKRGARRLTPLLKYVAAEKAVSISRMALQIHGGNGYTTEYGAEKMVRDSIVMPIYEGTSQIQALMAMKDTVSGILKSPQDFVRQLAQARWRSLSSRDPLERSFARLQATSLGAQQSILTRTAGAKVRGLRGKPVQAWRSEFTKEWDPKEDFAFAKLHAERLTRILCDVVIAECLWEQAKTDPERRVILEAHLERAEPRARFFADEIATTGARLLRKLGRGAPNAEQNVS